MAPEVLNLYVDGASRGNQHTMEERSTGWGFLAVLGPEGEGGSGTIIAEDSGTVVTDPNQVGYWGADVESNNTAELTAFIQALRWALMEGGDSNIVVCTDSTYAGNMATGAWRPKTNLEIISRLRSLWNEVDRIRGVRWLHVRAHRGHRWNERADHLAGRVADGSPPLPLSFWKPGKR